MSDPERPLQTRAEEFLTLFTKGAELTRELVHENAHLRRRLLQMQQQTRLAARDPADWERHRRDLLHRIEGLEGERKETLSRLEELEHENEEFARRQVEVEQENNSLASLYVASFQLHSTLDLEEVLRIVVEIVINLIGAERFVVYLVDDKTGILEPVASEGEPAEGLVRIPLGQGILGGAALARGATCRDATASEDPSAPIVCIPLRIEDRPLGAIAIYNLLQQKDCFTPLDHELFNLLAGHAATAIFSARLYAQSERKRNTMQGLLQLLTK
ncbi:hypothetical protein MYXO_00607 [Myxococcaceae bacterium]|jgi:hypothetical protein|nr:hypothetical protein MYXO_00607 [Myxococcaceae bacterium]